MRAILLSQHQLDGRREGTVFFDPTDGTLSIRGDFYAVKTQVPVLESAHCQLMVAESSIWLNVIVTPGRKMAGNIEHLRFELEN